MTMTVAQPNAIGSPGYAAEVPCVRESVSLARAFISQVLAVWGMDDDVTGWGKIIVTELLANAVEHTETPVSRIHIERPSQRCRPHRSLRPLARRSPSENGRPER